MDEIIKHLEDLEYRISGSSLDLSVIRNQLSALAGLVGDVAVEIKRLKEGK